jgi:hypothetical protein
MNAPEGSANFGMRIGHQFVIAEGLTASRTLEGTTLRTLNLTAAFNGTALLGWLDSRLSEALSQLGPLPSVAMNAPFSIRPTVSTAAWGGGTLSGTVAHPQTKPLGQYNVFLDSDAAHVLGGLQ